MYILFSLIFVTVPLMSTVCSAFIWSRVMSRAMKVPVRPTPALHGEEHVSKWEGETSKSKDGGGGGGGGLKKVS